ncbi:hypothetical protein CYMTET_20994 [Cymbomonas tetramitiformis]|uniref:Uncharacterized protein n=1 Tax=Cymbomonas tetramitiformis TaxID=36881 RepID=A0AAE0G2W3_9CHLO|nr:hypothetical protein CYMTET_20994 [Cymbomonas tetramitiformis]
MPTTTSILAASGRYFMDNEKEERSANADLLEIIMDLRGQVRDTATHAKTLSDRVSGKGFTPRAEKSNLTAIGRGHKGYRTGAGPLADGGNYSQGISNKVLLKPDLRWNFPLGRFVDVRTLARHLGTHA